MRHHRIVLRLDDQHVATKLRAGGQGPIAFGGHRAAPIDGELRAVELRLGLSQSLSCTARGPQREPAHRPSAVATAAR